MPLITLHLMEIDMRKFNSADGQIEYIFEELFPIKGVDLMVTGYCDISYEIDSDDPDVGYSGGVGVNIGRIYLKGLGGVPDLPLDKDNHLYTIIEAALIDKDSVYSECIADAISNRDAGDY